MKIYDMPKLESPFEREEVDDKYVCIPKIKDEFRWVFTDESIAVDKIDGTNVSVWIRNYRPFAIMNRLNEIDIWRKNGSRYLSGVVEAIDRHYFSPLTCEDGGYFGELIGPKIQGNPYNLKTHLWVPFSYMVGHYYLRFWPEFIKEIKGKSDFAIFDEVDELMKAYWSPYKRAKRIQGNIEDINKNIGFEGLAGEGVVVYRKGYENDYSKCCKIRRDQFDWYQGRKHKE